MTGLLIGPMYVLFITAVAAAVYLLQNFPPSHSPPSTPGHLPQQAQPPARQPSQAPPLTLRQAAEHPDDLPTDPGQS